MPFGMTPEDFERIREYNRSEIVRHFSVPEFILGPGPKMPHRASCPFCNPQGRERRTDRFCRIIDDSKVVSCIPRYHGEPSTLIKKHCILELRKVAEEIKDERGGEYRIEATTPVSGHWHVYAHFKKRRK